MGVRASDLHQCRTCSSRVIVSLTEAPFAQCVPEVRRGIRGKVLWAAMQAEGEAFAIRRITWKSAKPCPGCASANDNMGSSTAVAVPGQVCGDLPRSSVHNVNALPRMHEQVTSRLHHRQTRKTLILQPTFLWRDCPQTPATFHDTTPRLSPSTISFPHVSSRNRLVGEGAHGINTIPHN